jgi:hypothetical protein
MHTVVHVTHETIHKIGGIGAVLHGLLTSRVYLGCADRNILVGPYWQTGEHGDARLGAGGTVIYSSLDGINRTPLGQALADIEARYEVAIVFGRRTFTDARSGVSSSPEALLIDVSRYDAARIGEFKFRAWERFGLDSSRYDRNWDFEQWMRLGEPAIDALRAIGAADPAAPSVILSHEYMGVPTVLASMLADDSDAFRSIFHAHEVATIRRLVEDHPGHDARFYNAMRAGRARGEYAGDVFGSQDDFYKHALISNVARFDELFGVGDSVLEEFQFLSPDMEEVRATLAYNGTPHFEIDAAEKERSRNLVLDYCQTLLGHRPDLILTHVTRLVSSKGLWRDLEVMAELDTLLHERGLTAALIVLSTEGPARRPDEIRKMEHDYGWPLAHREGHPDLTGGEANFYARVQRLNSRSRNVKAVFLNQFGFTRETCGLAMPAEIDWMDLRKATDVEFGQSIYEPFGIAQIEPISFGGICVYTSLCGCAGLVKRAVKAAGLEHFPNAIEADYTRLPASMAALDPLRIGAAELKSLERDESRRLAAELMRTIPTTATHRSESLARGQRAAAHMSWDAVAAAAIVPGIERVAAIMRQ